MPQLLVAVALAVTTQVTEHFASSIEAHSVVTVPFHADEMD